MLRPNWTGPPAGNLPSKHTSELCQVWWRSGMFHFWVSDHIGLDGAQAMLSSAPIFSLVLLSWKPFHDSRGLDRKSKMCLAESLQTRFLWNRYCRTSLSQGHQLLFKEKKKVPYFPHYKPSTKVCLMTWSALYRDSFCCKQGWVLLWRS